MTDTGAEITNEEIIIVREGLRALDCGHLRCRYCDAGSPDWNHSRSCPYEHSVRIVEQARAILDRIQQAFPLSSPAQEPQEVPTGSCLLCGHLKPFAVFTNCRFDDPLRPVWVGVCEHCRRAAVQPAPSRTTLMCAAHMLDACAENMEKLCVGYGAEQMRGIAERLREGTPTLEQALLALPPSPPVADRPTKPQWIDAARKLVKSTRLIKTGDAVHLLEMALAYYDQSAPAAPTGAKTETEK